MNTTGYIKRISDNSFQIYVCLFLFVFVLLGVFGIWPGVKSFIAKNTLIKNLSKLGGSLAAKASESENIQAALKAGAPYIKTLDTSIPSEPLTGDFLSALAIAASDAGFSLKSFTVSSEDATSKVIATEFTGSRKDLDNLSRNIEMIKRLKVIKTINFTTNDSGVHVNIELMIFYMGD